MARLVTGDGLVDLLDNWLGVPFSRTPVPVVEPNLAAEVQHEGLKWGGRIEVKPHRMQL